MDASPSFRTAPTKLIPGRGSVGGASTSLEGASMRRDRWADETRRRASEGRRCADEAHRCESLLQRDAAQLRRDVHEPSWRPLWGSSTRLRASWTRLFDALASGHASAGHRWTLMSTGRAMRGSRQSFEAAVLDLVDAPLSDGPEGSRQGRAELRRPGQLSAHHERVGVSRAHREEGFQEGRIEEEKAEKLVVRLVPVADHVTQDLEDQRLPPALEGPARLGGNVPPRGRPEVAVLDDPEVRIGALADRQRRRTGLVAHGGGRGW